MGSIGSTAVEVIMHFHRIKKGGKKSQIRKFLFIGRGDELGLTTQSP